MTEKVHESQENADTTTETKFWRLKSRNAEVTGLWELRERNVKLAVREVKKPLRQSLRTGGSKGVFAHMLLGWKLVPPGKLFSSNY